MRQLHVLVQADQARRVLERAAEHKAFSPTAVRAERMEEGEWTMVFLNLPNDRVGSFIWAVREEVDDAHFTLFPRGALPVQTPLTEINERVRDVSHRSTLELVLDSFQSLGSWKGMLLYAAFSGVIAAYGVIFNTSYLLVAAMLVAPMGAPAMVAVIGTAIGDWKMFGRGAIRFVAALAVLVVTALALGYAYRLSFSTAIMEAITSLSAWGALVALVAGAAGAQSQVQSERTSLVTGTATGFLIAAALSPTSAVLGLAIPLQRWDYAALMGFQLGLQFVAIVAGGWLALLLYDVRPGDPSAKRGSGTWRTVLAGTVSLAVVLFTWWQTTQAPRFVKADLSRQAIELSRQAVQTVPGARLIEANAHFTRPDLEGRSGEGLLLGLVVQDTIGTTNAQDLESAIRAATTQNISSGMPNVVPFVDVTVLPGSGSK
jgi:uncharacterized membrane protein